MLIFKYLNQAESSIKSMKIIYKHIHQVLFNNKIKVRNKVL